MERSTTTTCSHGSAGCRYPASAKPQYKSKRPAYSQGDAVNAVLAAAGYNFRLLLNWMKDFLHLYRMLLLALRKTVQT